MSPYRILFVCMGNICRSPAGEGVLLHLIKNKGVADKIICDSAGTIGYHEGHPPDSRMQLAARKRGIHLPSRARQIKRTDLDTFDLILTMDEENYRSVHALAQKEAQRAKIRRFCEFCTRHEDSEVPDPYYGGEHGFEHVLNLMEDGCEQVLNEALKKT